MHIDIRSTNVRLPRAQAHSLAERLREAFGRLALRIVRVVVRVAQVARPGSAGRECTVEVHLPNGEVTLVKERQRKLGALLRRATERAWKAVSAAIARQPDPQSDYQPVLRLPLRGHGSRS
jgi:hypothetical protein